MLRPVLAVILGVVVGGLVVFGFENWIQAWLAPIPEGTTLPGADAGPEEWAAFLDQLPLLRLVLLVAGWGAGACAGSATAMMMGARASLIPSTIVILLLLAATVSNFFLFPHPGWVVVVGPIAVLAGGYLGARLPGRGTAG